MPKELRRKEGPAPSMVPIDMPTTGGGMPADARGMEQDYALQTLEEQRRAQEARQRLMEIAMRKRWLQRYGIDFDPAELEVAREQAIRTPTGRMEFGGGEGYAIPAGGRSRFEDEFYRGE